MRAILSGRQSKVNQAFAKWQKGRPWDFVLTDFCFLPGAKIRNGLDLISEIHLVDPSQKIIVQSGEWNPMKSGKAAKGGRTLAKRAVRSRIVL